MPIDTALVGALHVEYLRKRDVRGSEHPHHALFQTSTIDALLGGNYEGDVSFAELRARGDFGLGTFDALDGEMVALDGDFYQVKADGIAYEVDERLKTRSPSSPSSSPTCADLSRVRWVMRTSAPAWTGSSATRRCATPFEWTAFSATSRHAACPGSASPIRPS